MNECIRKEWFVRFLIDICLSIVICVSIARDKKNGCGCGTIRNNDTHMETQQVLELHQFHVCSGRTLKFQRKVQIDIRLLHSTKIMIFLSKDSNLRVYPSVRGFL